MPALTKIHDAYSEQEVVIIAVHDSTLPTIAAVLAKIEQTKNDVLGGRDLPFRIALAGSGIPKVDGKEIRVQGQAIADYGITAFPTALLIDRQGNLVGELAPANFEGTKKRIDSLLGK